MISVERGGYMISRQIRPGLWYIGALEEALRTFASVSFTESGMMYNSYLMDAGGRYLLFGAPPARFVEDWLAQADSIAGLANIGWAVLFGTDDDRAAAKALLEKNPETVIISGTNALYKLSGFAGEGFRKLEVRTDRTLVLGEKTLSFRVVQDKGASPSLYVLDREQEALFTADAFGSVYASDSVLVSELEDKAGYLRGTERYFADILGSRRPKTMAAAAALVRDNGVKLICPACGPVADTEQDALLSLYTAEPAPKPEAPTVAVVYAPGNYVRELADFIEHGVRESGPVAVKQYDLSSMSREQVLKELPGADAYLFGTPEPQGDAAKAVWDIVTSLRKDDCKGKLATVFTSTSSVGSAAENLRARFAQLGFDLNGRDYSVQGKPDKQGLKNAYEYGFGFGCLLQKIPNPHKPTLVKCLVCGEIFDASLGICPVCGVGLDQCVPVDEDAVVFRNDTENRYLILGGGVAAVSAAEAIRRRDETGSITLLSAEKYLPINRPMLTKDLEAIANDPDSIRIHDQAWYDERNLTVKLGVSALALDTEAKTVAASDGVTYPYDKLIYATGAECFVPPFEGHDKPGVITIRHLEDNRELQRRMKGARSAVVIGGGVLGLEAASELFRSGLHVTVLEATPQIIGRQADAESAAILKGVMEGLGVACYEGVSIAGIEGEEQATGVRLADGRVFPADFVVVSCGNRGNIGPAKAAGIAVDRSIVVNQRMETSAPDVYACGDCCQFDGVNFQLWQEASDQGRTAGANAAGEVTEYANQLLGLSLEGFGTNLFALGDPGKKPGVRYQTVETTDGVTGRHEKYWFFGGSLQGAVLIGAPEKTADVTKAVTEHARHSELF